MIAWFVAPYKLRDRTPHTDRYCAMDDFTRQIYADAGDWSETEVLGDCAIVKVRARPATLDQIAATAGFYRFPVPDYHASLASLNTAEEQGLHNILQAMGYTTGEIAAALGADFRGKKLSDVLEFAATRRKEPRYNRKTDTITLDGTSRPCHHPAFVNAKVSE